MNYNFRSAKITAPPNDINWGGCFVENDLIILLQIETDGSIIAAHLGKSLLDQLLLVYGQLKTKDKLAAKSLLREVSGTPFVKAAVIGLSSDQNLYLGAQGDGQAILIRNGDSEVIISGGFISHGQIVSGDRIVFLSQNLEKLLKSGNEDQIFKNQSLSDVEEELAAFLSTNQDAKGSAIIEIVVEEKGTVPELSQLTEKLPVKNILDKLDNLKDFPRKKFFLPFSFILALILIFNIFSGLIRNKNSQKYKAFVDTINLITSQYEEAQNLIDLNPVRSRELLASTKLSISKTLKLFKKNSKEYKQLNQWLNKISTAEIAAYKIYKLTAVPVFFDISLIKPAGIAEKLAAYQENKALLDKQNQTVYFLNTQTKQASVLAGSDSVKQAIDLAIHGSFVYILNADGIYQVELETKNSQKAIVKDSNWGEIVSIEAFGGNLYLLDKKNNAIWKYVATSTGFSTARNYLNPGVLADLSSMNNMSIDGSIWTSSPQDLFKFSAGEKESFSFKGFSDTISKIDGLSTSDNEKNIYVLDKTISRIIVFDKDGLYQSQYQWDELKNAQDFVASEKEGKIYVLIESYIYAIDIK